MNTSSWMVHAYVVSNLEVQGLIAGLLSGFRGVAVETSTSGGRPLVIVEVGDARQAQAVHDVIATIDWGATPIDTGPEPADMLIA